MANPILPAGARPVAPPPATVPARPAPSEEGGGDFAALVREQLAQVARMQNEANERVQELLTGRSESMTEVFTAARKAELAFSLLMEIRNKLIDAYNEIKDMRV